MNLLESARTSDTLDTIATEGQDGATRYSLTEENWEFDYFYHPKRKKNLYVFFPSALMPGKRLVPSFHRWSWAPLMPDADVLCVSDPTLRLDQDLLGGWFQGRGEDWVLPRILKHIALIQQKLRYGRVVFCGSSLGGFAALQAGVLAPSIDFAATDIRVFAENPQISLPLYNFRSHMQKLAQVSYAVSDLAEVPEYALMRLDIVRLVHQLNHVPRGLVVVKESDTHHHQVHAKLLRDGIPLSHRSRLSIEVIPTSIDATGHTALTLAEMLKRINSPAFGHHSVE